MFKLKIFSVTAFLLFLFLSPLIAKADIAIVEPTEPFKNAIDCVSFSFSPQIQDFLLVGEFSEKTLDGIIDKFEPIKEEECYLVNPSPNLNSFSRTIDLTVPQGKYLEGVHVFWKKYLPDNFMAVFSSADEKWMENIKTEHRGGSNKYYLGELMNSSKFWNSGFGWELIKKDNPTKHIVAHITIQYLSADMSHNVLNVGEIRNIFVFNIQYKDGAEKQMTQREFDDFVKANAPKFENVSRDVNYNSYVRPWFDIIKNILQIAGLLFLSFYIEAIVFYFFGARRVQNYLWLLLANLISYPLAVGVIFLLVDKLSSWDLFSNSDIVAILVIWLPVEMMVFFIEYGIMYLGLRNHYPKRQIAWFVFMANLITALIGLAISLYLVIV